MAKCNHQVLITGLVAVDIIIVAEKFPKEDEKGKALAHYKQRGGNAANTSEILSRLGITTHLFSYLETGENGQFVKKNLEGCGVDTSLCILQDEPGFPTSYCILSQETFSRTVLHNRSKNYEPKFGDFVEKLKDSIDAYNWFHFEGRGFPDTTQILKYLHDRRVNLSKTELYPKSRKFKISIELERVKSKEELLETLPYADVAFISKDFATSLGYASAKEAAMQIKADQKLPEDTIVVVPWGDAGADAVGSDNIWYHCDASPPDTVADTIGAGDTFNAAMIHCLMNEWLLNDALKFSCELAGRKCGMYGFEGLI